MRSTQEEILGYLKRAWINSLQGQREAEYQALILRFAPIAMELQAERRTELDGLLWDLSLRLVQNEK